MSMILADSKSGDPRNAQFLAAACEIAYLPEPAGSAKFKESLGLDAKLISASNTQVYVATSDTAIVVAFRGSEAPTSLDGLKDWLLTNANDLLILPEGRIGTDFAAAGVGARFHRGFLSALGDIWDGLFPAVEAAVQAKERPVWVTGHSLGGALALLAAWRFQQNFIQVHEVYTFGAPMIGNAAAAKAFEKDFPGKVYRFVDCGDPVPELPTFSLVANEYGHCVEEVLLQTEHREESQAQPLLKSEFGEEPSTTQPEVADKIWSFTQKRIQYHMIDHYSARIAEMLKA